MVCHLGHSLRPQVGGGVCAEFVCHQRIRRARSRERFVENAGPRGRADLGGFTAYLASVLSACRLVGRRPAPDGHKGSLRRLYQEILFLIPGHIPSAVEILDFEAATGASCAGLSVPGMPQAPSASAGLWPAGSSWC